MTGGSMRRRLIVLAAVLAISVPAVASGTDRLFGFGWNGALGIYSTKWETTFAFDAGVEFRLFPTENFSFDFTFDIAEAPAAAQVRTFFHFHVREGRSDVYFSAAPYLAVQGIPTTDVFIEGDAVGLGGRVGMELLNDNEMFAMGLYLRPGVFYRASAGNISSNKKLYSELVVEMTWIIYPPVPQSSGRRSR